MFYANGAQEMKRLQQQLIDSQNKYQLQYKMNLAKQDRDSLLAPITKFNNVKTIANKRLGLDMNNLIGIALQEIRDICHKLETSSPHQKMRFIIDIRQKQQKVVKELLNKIHIILQNKAKVVAVFDGAKTQKIKQIKTYLTQERKLKKKSEKQAKDYLKGSSVIEQIFYKRQYKIQNSQTYWQVYEETIQCLIINLKLLEKYGVNIFVAPYQADIQLVKLFQLRFIDIVVSNDKDYVNHGVPLISKFQQDGKFQMINVSVAELQENSQEHPYKFIKSARENPIKHAMFAALSGSKHLPKLKSYCGKPIPTILLIQIIDSSQNLGEVFKRLRQSFKNFLIPYYYQQLAELTLIVELLSPYYNPKSGKIECSNDIIFEMIKDRQLHIDNLHKIWNQYYTIEVSQGLVNINTHQKREFISNYLVDNFEF